MKTIVLGDTHGRSFWKLVLNTEQWDEAILIGDYFDTHESITSIEQLKNFDELCEFKRSSKKPVILLIGNHDHHYFPEVGYTGTSGYQSGAAPNIELALDQNRDLLQMAHYQDNILFTHAGLSEMWMKKNFVDPILTPLTAEWLAEEINELWKHKPLSFCFTGGWDHTGDDVQQTPIWIRPKSLYKSSKEIKSAGVKQVVGHTQVKEIDVEDGNKYGYFFIDTLGTSREYLVIENGEFSKAIVMK